MAERIPFLNARYSAYHHRERPGEDAELARVGPGTPCGEYLRRFWQPVILAEELGDLPRRVRIMGEDLVAFRDRSGASACWSCIARIAAPRSNSAWSLIRGSAAAITAGCSTSTARSSKLRGNRRTAP